jgi:hypothetical protein
VYIHMYMFVYIYTNIMFPTTGGAHVGKVGR